MIFSSWHPRSTSTGDRRTGTRPGSGETRHFFCRLGVLGRGVREIFFCQVLRHLGTRKKAPYVTTVEVVRDSNLVPLVL